jgi:putative FmdB family regulatory protein
MPTYSYECSIHKEFEAQHSIKAPPLSVCPKCVEEKVENPPTPKRLISLSSFVLASGGVGWARDKYSK